MQGAFEWKAVSMGIVCSINPTKQNPSMQIIYKRSIVAFSNICMLNNGGPVFFPDTLLIFGGDGVSQIFRLCEYVSVMY